MKQTHLVISEKFYSLQGEGQTMGIPAVFIRLAGCNLLCEGTGWRCDSIEVWAKGEKTFFENVLETDWIKRLEDGAHLIFTGGEPLLHQGAIVAYLTWFKDTYKFLPTIEVETNGTLYPTSEFMEFIDYWNVSPKLSNSGEPIERRVSPNVLSKINLRGKSVIFKFVISKDEDVLEILTDYAGHINMRNVVLMPAGSSQEELSRTRLMVAQKAILLGVRFSDRLHINIWNKKTGV